MFQRSVAVSSGGVGRGKHVDEVLQKGNNVPQTGQNNIEIPPSRDTSSRGMMAFSFYNSQHNTK
jgi:hypothetical protein